MDRVISYAMCILNLHMIVQMQIICIKCFLEYWYFGMNMSIVQMPYII